jgi:hypothetical protein
MERVSGPLIEVEITPSEPPEPPRVRKEDRLRLRDQDWRSQFVVGFKWIFAVVVRDWKGLSLLRLIAITTAVATNELAHDWVKAAAANKTALGWAFGAFVLGGFFLAALLALGEKYIDKMLTIIAAKLGVALVNAPVPDIIMERKPGATTTTTTTTDTRGPE